MNPVIVIPTYWSDRRAQAEDVDVGGYDHTTPLDQEVPEVERCLSSLDHVRGVVRIVVLLVCPPACERAVRRRVNTICLRHPRNEIVVIGSAEASAISRVVSRIAPEMGAETISLMGYGAIRNMGLAVAAILGHDVVVFMDDDEITLSNDFLVDAVYGLGQQTRQGLPVVAKSGYFLDLRKSPFADMRHKRWYDANWTKTGDFNRWMQRALDSTRISRSNASCGGCLALHAEAFTRIAFDPYITRGEDLDYLFNLRMYGLDMWFDNQWCVQHLPPKTASRPSRFLQDIFRWEYERAKILHSNASIGTGQVTAGSLMPYPGPWISSGLANRIFWTSLWRAIGCPEHKAYLSIWAKGRREARAYAAEMSTRYLSFMTYWPVVMARLWGNAQLAEAILKSGQVTKREMRL